MLPPALRWIAGGTVATAGYAAWVKALGDRHIKTIKVRIAMGKVNMLAGEEWKATDWRTAPDAADPTPPPRPREQVLAEAREGIEKHRKADADLRLVTPDGKPVAGLAVEVVQKRQEFRFGAPLADEMYKQRTPEEQDRCQRFKSLFNLGVALCYWNEGWHFPIERHQGRRETREFLAAVDWAVANGLEAKGHTLIFAAPKCYPDWLKKYSMERQMQFLECHVRNMIACAEGKVTMWDLCNEMLWEPSFRHYPSRHWPHIEPIEEMLTYIEPAMRWAREEDPDAVFMLNDYGLENHKMPYPAWKQRRRFVELAREMKRRGCAPDAIATQAHIGGWHEMGHWRQVFDELSEPGLPLHCTEFWLFRHEWPGNSPERTQDEFEQAQADYAVDWYTVGFGHPNMRSLSYWGFGDFYRDNQRTDVILRPVKMYDALKKLIRGDWMTQTTATTDAEGRLRFRGFHGNYALRFADSAANPHSVPFTLSSTRSNTATVRLP